MAIDWAALGVGLWKWVSSAGVLSGLTALGWRLFDAWRSALKAEDDKLKVTAKTLYGAAGMIDFSVSFLANQHEGMLATVAVLEPKGAQIVGYSKGQRMQMGRVRFDLTGAVSTVSEVMAPHDGSPELMTARFCIGGAEPVPSAWVRVTVTSTARSKTLIKRKKPVSPTH